MGVVLLLGVGCRDGAAPVEPGADATSPPAVPVDLTAEQMYSLDTIPDLHLTLDEAAVAALGEAPKEYVRGTFAHGGAVLEGVGIRLKGNYTLVPLTEKPSFKVKFNLYEPGRRFIGLEGLTLNSMHHDPSMMREYLAYRVFRHLGVPASRVGYARVWVNDEPYGLYANLEPYNDDFLERRFEDPTGNLYEAEHGNDLDYNLAKFDQDEGEDESRDDLEAFSQLALGSPDAVFYGPDAVLDTDGFLRFVVAESITGHFDGYQTRHNYFLYHQPSEDLWHYLPWSLDQAFVRRTGPFEGKGLLARRCFDELPACRGDYVRLALALTDQIEALDLPGLADQVRDHIASAARGDERKRHSNSSMESAWKGLRGYVAGRPQGLRAGLDCLAADGSEPDADGDGFGACWVDCDDADPEIHRGAEEICDGIDNDCSGFADDVPQCPCPSEIADGREFFFCQHGLNWTAAGQHCEAAGLVHARIDSAEQHQVVTSATRAIRGGWWSIGLNDRQTEGEHLWADGAEPIYTAWADGEPSGLLPQYDCVVLSGGTSGAWLERNCNEVVPFVCSDQGP